LPFRSLAEVEAQQAAIRAFVAEAMDRARRGQKVDAAPAAEALPDELEEILAATPSLARAFDALTPGRRRSHALYVASAKQSATRTKRAAACARKILEGRGWNERPSAADRPPEPPTPLEATKRPGSSKMRRVP
jgi:uncharacterized protein YdeI (YjbR/CyaY-like superfamily)